MSSFKISKKTVHTDSRTSIIDKHLETIKKIEDDKTNLDKYRSELILLEKTKKNFESKNNYSDAFNISRKIDNTKTPFFVKKATYACAARVKTSFLTLVSIHNHHSDPREHKTSEALFRVSGLSRQTAQRLCVEPVR